MEPKCSHICHWIVFLSNRNPGPEKQRRYCLMNKILNNLRIYTADHSGHLICPVHVITITQANCRDQVNSIYITMFTSRIQSCCH